MGAASAARAESVDEPADVEHARTLAQGGERDRAITVLQRRLAEVPDDGDALTLLGIVLSWEDRYDEARAGRGLAVDPGSEDLAVLLQRSQNLTSRLAAERRVWQVGASYSYDGFD